MEIINAETPAGTRAALQALNELLTKHPIASRDLGPMHAQLERRLIRMSLGSEDSWSEDYVDWKEFGLLDVVKFIFFIMKVAILETIARFIHR
jgi:hypothetical protein